MKRKKFSVYLLVSIAALLSGCAELPTEHELNRQVFRTIPPRPDTLIASTISSDSVQISWTPSTFAVTYALYFDSNTVDTTKASCRKIDTLHGLVTVVNGLTAGVRYAFSVVAQNELGRSQQSHCDTATPLTLTLPPGMKLIPGGVFQMGDTSEYYGYPDERPIHPVVLSPFYMDSTETQQSDYYGLMGNNSSWHQDSNLNLPVENVSWYDAVFYCNKRSVKEGLSPVYAYSDTIKVGSHYILSNLTADYGTDGYRLPTEAEWEYACRARTSSQRYWGDNISDVNIYAHTYYRYIATADANDTLTNGVATLDDNQYGLYDMIGNVWEWCNDWYEDDYYRLSERSNPYGPDSSGYKSLRGGCMITDVQWYLRSAYRNNSTPSSFSKYRGFRTVRPVR